MDMRQIGMLVRAARKSHGWTLEYVGRQCGLSKSQLSKFERGEGGVRLHQFLRICEFFDHNFDFGTDISSKPVASEKIWAFPRKEDAYRYIGQLLYERTVKEVDMVQFSGNTAIRILAEIPQRHPGVHVRLLLASKEISERYDPERFHWGRIQHTINSCRDIKEMYPRFNIEGWFCSHDPELSMIIIDDWLVSISWYRVSSSETSPNQRSIYGHSEPAVVAIDEACGKLYQWCRKKFDETFPSHSPDFKL